MFRITVNYEDIDGNNVEQLLYFHMSEKDWVKADADHKAIGGYSNFLEKSTKDNDAVTIVSALDDIVRRAYGIKSEDGKFVRNAALSEEFIDSFAYDAFLRELLYKPGVVDSFIKALSPNGGKMPDNLPSLR